MNLALLYFGLWVFGVSALMFWLIRRSPIRCDDCGRFFQPSRGHVVCPICAWKEE